MTRSSTSITSRPRPADDASSASSFSHSIRARRRAARSSSIDRARRCRRRSRSSRRSFRARVTSSTIRKTIWSTQLATAKEAIARAGISALDLAAIGVTNQRETTVLWEKATGKPIANAIVWQSRVTAPICDRLKAAGHEADVPAEDRSRRRRVFLRHEDQAPARFVRRPARSRRARRGAVRHHRHVPDLAADRRQASTSPTSATPAARCCSTSTRCSGTTSC